MYYWRRINIIVFAILLLLLVPSVFGLLQKGFFVTDDGTWMIIRLSAFFDTLRDGQIPVRFLERLNNGYGYPVSNFLYPGYLYIGSIVHLVGFSFIDSIKIIFAFSIVLSGIFTYFWLKKIFDPISSLIGSLFYVYAPYHLYDVYTRGSVGEVLALMWVPLVLWCIGRKNLVLTSWAIFLLVLSHNSLALLMLPIIFIYGLLRHESKRTILSISLGLAMSSFFVVPAVFELAYTKFSSVSVSSPHEYFADINLIGYSSVIAFALLALTLVKVKATKTLPNKSVLFLFGITFLISLFLSTQLSSMIWNTPISSVLQFPFRTLSFAIVSSSFIVAFAVSKWKGAIQIAVSFVLILVLGYSAISYILPRERVDFPDEYYSTNMDTTTVKDEYMPTWVKNKPLSMYKDKFELVSGNATIDIKNVNSRLAVAEIALSGPSVIRFNNIYYPGWEAYIGYNKIPITYDNELGVMDVSLAQSQGTLTFIFRETPLRLVSDLITLLAIIFSFFIAIRPLLKFK